MARRPLLSAFFRLNYIEADSDTTRPTLFATTADTPGTVIVLQR